VLEGDDLRLGCARPVNRADDLAQPPQVVGVVSDHQRVVGRVGTDRVVGRDQRPQHRHQVGGGLIAQLEHLGDDLVAARRRLRRRDDPPALQLGIRLGQDARDPHRRLDDGETLQPQRRQQLLVGLLLGDRPLGDEVDGPLDAWIDDELAPGVLADRPHCRLQV
jgi:hypothetical protein